MQIMKKLKKDYLQQEETSHRRALKALGIEDILETISNQELLGFKVNIITGKLEKAMPIEYRN